MLRWTHRWFSPTACRQKQENAFCLFSKRKLNCGRKLKICFLIHLEMRFRLVKAEIHWAVKYRLSDGQNYPRGIIWRKNYILRIIRRAELSRRNYPKITADQVVWVSSFHHLLPWNGRSSLEKKKRRQKCCWKIVSETVWSRQEYKNTNIWIFDP